MSKVNLGSVTFIPYYECYLAFDMEIDGFNGIGGYKTVNGWNYVFMCGTAEKNLTLNLPNKTDSYNLSYTKNGVTTPFTDTLSFVTGDTFSINVRYQ